MPEGVMLDQPPGDGQVVPPIDVQPKAPTVVGSESSSFGNVSQQVDAAAQPPSPDAINATVLPTEINNTLQKLTDAAAIPAKTNEVVVETPQASKIEAMSPVESEVDKYMPIVREAIFLPEGSPDREAKLLKLMDDLEEAKAKGEIELNVIGTGKDRAVLLAQPVETKLIEPVEMKIQSDDEHDYRFGNMETDRATYLVVNRAGFIGLAITQDQYVLTNPNAEMFTNPNSPFAGRDPWDGSAVANNEVGREMFMRQYRRWLDEDCRGGVRRSGLEGERRIKDLMQRKDYQERPNPDLKKYPAEGIIGLVQTNPDYIQDGKAWVDSDRIRPDGLWASFIKKSDIDVNTPTVRNPRGQWFDVGGDGYEPFRVNSPVIVEKVLEANVQSSKQPPVESPKLNTPPQATNI